MTPHAELDGVLRHWLAGLRAVLGGNLVGAYLQGSLAVGDFDAASDVDFMVALREDLPAADIGRIHALHLDLCQLPGPYAYAFWFVSEADPPVRREYDNCLLMRRVLREKGVRLLGPPPATLIDPVGDADLRREMAEMLACNQQRLASDASWFRTTNGQASGVLVFARALETLGTGKIASKRSALAFAQAQFEPRWANLVADAFDFRARHAADPGINGPSDPHAVAETLAFLDWAVEQSARYR